MMGQPDAEALAAELAVDKAQGRGTAADLTRKRLAAIGADDKGRPIASAGAAQAAAAAGEAGRHAADAPGAAAARKAAATVAHEDDKGEDKGDAKTAPPAGRQAPRQHRA